MKRLYLCAALILVALVGPTACSLRPHPPGRFAFHTIQDDTIYIGSLHSRKATPLASPYRPLGNPTWSPDGTAIAYFCATPTTGRGICIQRLDAGEVETIDESTLGVRPLMGDWGTRLAWAPHDDLLYFASERNGQGPTFIYELDITTGDLQTVHQHEFSGVGASIQEVVSIALSPSSAHMAITTSGGGIIVVDLVTGEEWFVAGGSGATWAPDGSRLALIGLLPQDLIIVSMDGEERRVTDLERWPPPGSLAWISNEDVILLESNDLTGDVLSLRIVNVESGQKEILIGDITGFSTGLDWSSVSTWPLGR